MSWWVVGWFWFGVVEEQLLAVCTSSIDRQRERYLRGYMCSDQLIIRAARQQRSSAADSPAAVRMSLHASPCACVPASHTAVLYRCCVLHTG